MAHPIETLGVPGSKKDDGPDLTALAEAVADGVGVSKMFDTL